MVKSARGRAGPDSPADRSSSEVDTGSSARKTGRLVRVVGVIRVVCLELFDLFTEMVDERHSETAVLCRVFEGFQRLEECQ